MKSMKPRISVVVSCYNKKKTIASCIDSLLKQNYGHYDVVVVDDGSTDGSLECIKSLADDCKVKAVRADHNGVSTAKNIGFKECSGDVVLFLDGDCVLAPKSLAELSASFSNHNIGCIGGEVRALNNGLTAKAVERMQNDIEQRKWPFGANVAYRRDAFTKAGGYDERMKIGEDADLYLRVRKLGFSSVMNHEVRAWTVNPSSIPMFFRQRLRWAKGFAQLTKKHKEAFTLRIKFCFILTLATMLSPILGLLDLRLLIVAAALLAISILRHVPSTIEVARRSGDYRHTAIIPILRFLNAVAYLTGWLYWKVKGFLWKSWFKH